MLINFHAVVYHASRRYRRHACLKFFDVLDVRNGMTYVDDLLRGYLVIVFDLVYIFTKYMALPLVMFEVKPTLLSKTT